MDPAQIEKQSFDAYNESDVLIGAIERYHERTGHYPERVPVDKIYRNRKNLSFCKEHGIRITGPALGRPKKNILPEEKCQAYERMRLTRSKAKGTSVWQNDVSDWG